MWLLSSKEPGGLGYSHSMAMWRRDGDFMLERQSSWPPATQKFDSPVLQYVCVVCLTVYSF